MSTLTPTNILQNVQTWQPAQLAWLQNSYCLISITNKKFNNFENMTANLGDTVTFDKPPRFRTMNGLVTTQQPSKQEVQSLAVTQAYNVSRGYTDQQWIFNVDKYMDVFGKAAAEEMGATIESDLAKIFSSEMRVNDPQNENYGEFVDGQGGPYRFYGNGIDQINSVGQLSEMLAQFRAFGAASNCKAVLPIEITPQIISTALNQFVGKRNDEYAMDWELGRFNQCDWYESNLLHTHVAGSIGQQSSPNNILTVVSTNDPTGKAVTQITCTEPTSSTDADAIKRGDMGQFMLGVAGRTNVFFRTYTGHVATRLPAQILITADAATVSGTVTITIDPPICWAATANQNVTTPIVAGMKIKLLPTHVAAALWSGDQFYMAAPRLPDTEPFSNSTVTDPDSGMSMRTYWGTQIGQNNRQYTDDCIIGATAVNNNMMRIIIPVLQ
jgi:hypothetical protein